MGRNAAHWNLHSLRSFVAVCEVRSFTAAALVRGASQPGISQHIRHMEEGLGTKLFIRESGGISPTPYATALYPEVVDLLRLLDRSADEMGLFRSGVGGKVNIGMLPALARAVGGPALLEFSRANPNASVRIIESLTRLPQMIRSGDIDCAIVSRVLDERDDPAGLVIEDLFHAPECLISGGAGGEGVSVASLPSSVKLAWVHRNGRRYDDVRDCLRLNGVEVVAEIEVSSAQACLSLVTGSGWSLVMNCIGLNVQGDARSIQVAPLTKPELAQPISLVTMPGTALGEAGREFVNTVCRLIEHQLNEWRRRFNTMN